MRPLHLQHTSNPSGGCFRMDELERCGGNQGGRQSADCLLCTADLESLHQMISDVSLFVIFHMTIFMGRQPGSWTRDTGTTHALPCTVLSNEVNRYLGSSWVAGYFNQGGVKGLVHCLDRTLLMWFQARKNEKSHKEPQRTTKKNKDHQHDQILTITIIMKQPKID